MQQRILFICTGNYYRSRFAEAVFNYHAELRSLPWRAFSRGLYIDAVPFGDISGNTRTALAARGIDLRHTGPTRVQVSDEDFKTAQKVIALDEEEHQPMMVKQFPALHNRITYWNVADLHIQGAEHALPSIESNVLALLDSLR